MKQRTKAARPIQASRLAASGSTHGGEPPRERCPTCGRPYDDAPIGAPFVERPSGLLDLVTVAKDALTEIQAALEEELVP